MKAIIHPDSIELVAENDVDRGRLIYWRRAVPKFSDGPTTWAPLPWAPDRSAFVETFRIDFVDEKTV